MARVATLRSKPRLPPAQRPWLPARLRGLTRSIGELAVRLTAAERVSPPASGALLAEARAGAAAPLDATGRHEDGRQGYVWTVTTPIVRRFRFGRGRAGRVARDLLGADHVRGPAATSTLPPSDGTASHQRRGAHCRGAT